MKYHVPEWAKGKDITTLDSFSFTCQSLGEECKVCVLDYGKCVKLSGRIPKELIERLAQHGLIPKALALKHLLEDTEILLERKE